MINGLLESSLPAQQHVFSCSKLNRLATLLYIFSRDDGVYRHSPIVASLLDAYTRLQHINMDIFITQALFVSAPRV